ncbi:MAG: hypothetical protein C5B50_15085 [Verrucomicrobia bacterium]|nr:MAG: hypothetical protein C5B50_15085 [Verrucomicrobiota bacterium]
MSKALKAAIEANDPEAVSKALKTLKNINRALPGARAPLLYAAEKGADKVLDVLFKAGAVAEKRHTFPGDTPFAIAARCQQVAVMRRLVDLKQASDLAIEYVLYDAGHEGNLELLESILQTVKPDIDIVLFRLARRPNNASEMLKLLVKNGGDVRLRHDTIEAKRETVLHDATRSGKAHVLRTLIELGADVNARDDLGRTPLMVLAASVEGIEFGNAQAESLHKLFRSGAAGSPAGESPGPIDSFNAVETLLELGADASLTDHYGNDAIDHFDFEFARSGRATTGPRIRKLMLKLGTDVPLEDPSDNDAMAARIRDLLLNGGAKGSGPTLKLFAALREEDVPALRAAIAAGGDVNRIHPPPGSGTPLTWACSASAEMVSLLLKAGADPNIYDPHKTPLIHAAGCGYLDVVKLLLAAGADLHAIRKDEDFPDNAYSSALGDQEYEVADYLKSLGAGRPKPTKKELLKPGVGSWNDFSELLVKATVEKTAQALGKLIGGETRLNAYGVSLMPGPRSFVVARPEGMEWCNVFQVTPPRRWIEDSKKIAKFAVGLAKAAKASVLSIEYSDTSDAASILRVEPDGKKSTDAGWDRDMLADMVEAMGDKAPAWAKKKLAKTDEDEPSSTERLEMLAEDEKFVVAAFGLQYEPGRKLDIEFEGYLAEHFQGVVFVST